MNISLACISHKVYFLLIPWGRVGREKSVCFCLGRNRLLLHGASEKKLPQKNITLPGIMVQP